MKDIHFIDTTLRDGQTPGMMLPIVESIDRAGFEGMELLSSAFFKKCVRDLKDDLWERALGRQTCQEHAAQVDSQPLHAGFPNNSSRDYRSLVRTIGC